MFYFFSAFILSVLSVLAVKWLAVRYQILDRPDHLRKLQSAPVPLWGGAAIFLSFWIVVGYLALFTDLLTKHFGGYKLFGVFVGSVIILLLGLWEDWRELGIKKRFIFTALAVLAVLFGGVYLDGITNPFGGILPLDFWKINFGILGNVLVVGDTVVFFWLMGMMYTTKILDGLDGLTTGITLIGAIVIYFLTTTTKFHQTDTAILALVLIGACAGFLLFNFYPAKIYLGESGSLFTGFILGVLSITAGGKIATALLVMGIPILDLIRVIWHRKKLGRSIFSGDREHLHFRLVDSGWSVPKTVIFLYLLALLFGLSTLFLSSIAKIVALIILAVGFVGLEIFVSHKIKKI